MNKDLVIIPTYNESVNCTLIYEKIRLTNKDIHILFIDDSSPDNTAEIIKLIQNKDTNVFLLERNKKKELVQPIRRVLFGLIKNFIHV